jgi:hypothetical protein
MSLLLVGNSQKAGLKNNDKLLGESQCEQLGFAWMVSLDQSFAKGQKPWMAGPTLAKLSQQSHLSTPVFQRPLWSR